MNLFITSPRKRNLQVNVRHFLLMTALWVFCASAFGVAPPPPPPGVESEWEKTARSFREGDLAAVKRILTTQSEPYSAYLLGSSVRSGNIDLVKYLGEHGWFEACREDTLCDPVNSAVSMKLERATPWEKRRKMLELILSQGFPTTEEALLHASAQYHGTVTEENFKTLKADFELVKLLCEKGADPAGAIKFYEENKGFDKFNGSPGGFHPFAEVRQVSMETQIAAFFKQGKCKTGAMASTGFDDYLGEVQAFRNGRLDEIKKIQAERDAAQYDPHTETYLLYEALAFGNIDLLRYLKDLGWLERCRERSSFCKPLDAMAEIAVHYGWKRWDDNKLAEFTNPGILRFLISEGFEPGTLTYPVYKEYVLKAWEQLLEDNQTDDVSPF